MITKKIAFLTLGCKVNQAEENLMRTLCQQVGFQVVQEEADIYIINTCTVTRFADLKSRQLIRRILTDPKAKVIVTGCYAQWAKEEIQKIDERLIVVDNSWKNRITELLGENSVPQEVKYTKRRTRATLLVQNGCDRHCSYCIVPKVRGKSRSLPLSHVKQEVETLLEQGYREIVLTGVDLGDYGKGLPEEVNLLTLLEMLCQIELFGRGEARIRLSSVEPSPMLPQIASWMKNYPQVCPHLHIPLQHSSNKILQKMNRFYTAELFAKWVEEIRFFLPDIALTTDLIVGFPSETEDDFQHMLNFTRKLNFSRFHVFRFSARPSTPAYDDKDLLVEESEKKRRSRILIELGRELSENYRQKFIGQSLPVLVESKKNKRGLWQGLSHNYLRVSFASSEDNLQGKLVQIIVEDRE